VSKVTTAGGAIVTFAVSSPSLDEEAVSWAIDNEVTKVLLAVKGVGAVARVGGVSREVHVNLDSARMAALGVTASEVSAQLRKVQRDASGGRGDVGGAIQAVRTFGAVGSAAELAELEIPVGGGRTVRLKEVAEIADGLAERSKVALQDGAPVIGFEVTRVKGASEVAVANAVRAAVARFDAKQPRLQIVEAFNTVDPVEDNFNGSMQLLLEGAILAVVVVWWFLRDWRATLLVTATLPLSIIPTFAAMHYFGFSLNMLSLLALALVVGILVDDAIVEIENIVRHLGMGKPPLQAAREAADEIGMAVIATTFTLVAVFLPTAFMGGVPGKFFREFGITAAVAVLVSLLVARLLTPMLAAYWLHEHPPKPSTHSVMDWYLGRVKWCLVHRKTTMASAGVFVLASLALLPLLPTGFVPAADRAQTRINIEMAPGSSLADTHAAAERARMLIKDMPEVTGVFSTIGGAAAAGGPMGGAGASDIRKAVLTVNLTPRQERDKQNQVERVMRERLGALAGGRVTVGGGGSGETLRIALAGEDADALQTAAQNVTKELRGLQGIGSIASGASLQRPEIQITPNFARAADLGVTATGIADTIRVATAGEYEAALPKLNLPQRQVPIRVRLAPELRQDLDAVKQLRVQSGSGSVPLEAVATVNMGSGPAQIDRLDRQRNVVIEVSLGARLLGEMAKEAAQLPSLKNLPAGVTQPATGDAERMAEMFSSFGAAMLIGVLLIYMVLVILFHDFLQPITILAALPLSIGGALAALLITGGSFSLPSVIGLLMLMGVVTKNSILLVEYAVIARREHGMARVEALVDACHKRARPIVMTTIAMVAGMLPVALGLGAEPSFRSPMAVAVIGGLIASTMLSLLVIPVVFTYIDDLLGAIKRIAAGRNRAGRLPEPGWPAE
jgi:multidrug efflux pump subunit AcrB